MSAEATERQRHQTGELEALLTRYQEADEGAAAELIQKLSPQFFQFFLAQIGDRTRAEDLLQDFWLRIHSARRTYRPSEPVLPWLYAIARRVRIDQYRRTKGMRRHELQVETLPEAVADTRQSLGIDLRALLATLPETQRDVILMLKVSGLSLEEVARATRSSVGSVKQKAHRAYEKLRRMLEGREGYRRDQHNAG